VCNMLNYKSGIKSHKGYSAVPKSNWRDKSFVL
jgi:hypothetical protein